MVATWMMLRPLLLLMLLMLLMLLLLHPFFLDAGMLWILEGFFRDSDGILLGFYKDF